MVHEQLSRFYQRFPPRCAPDGGAVRRGRRAVGVLPRLRSTSTIRAHREISAFRLIAKLPTITAMTYKYNMGQPFMYPKNKLSYVENFLYMMFGTPCEEWKPNPVLTRAHGPHPDPARRSRAERLDLDRAARRLVRRQSVCLHRGRHRQPVGPGARRRQRGRAEDAGRDRRRQEHSAPSSSASRKRTATRC